MCLVYTPSIPVLDFSDSNDSHLFCKGRPIAEVVRRQSNQPILELNILCNERTIVRSMFPYKTSMYILPY